MLAHRESTLRARAAPMSGDRQGRSRIVDSWIALSCRGTPEPLLRSAEACGASPRRFGVGTDRPADALTCFTAYPHQSSRGKEEARQSKVRGIVTSYSPGGAGRCTLLQIIRLLRSPGRSLRAVIRVTPYVPRRPPLRFSARRSTTCLTPTIHRPHP